MKAALTVLSRARPRAADYASGGLPHGAHNRRACTYKRRPQPLGLQRARATPPQFRGPPQTAPLRGRRFGPGGEQGARSTCGGEPNYYDGNRQRACATGPAAMAWEASGMRYRERKPQESRSPVMRQPCNSGGEFRAKAL